MEGNREGQGHEEDEGQEPRVPLGEEAAAEVRDGQDIEGGHPVQEEDEAADNAEEDNEEDLPSDDDDQEQTRREEINPRMQLTDQERQWALAIKAAVVGNPELDNVSDFMYAHLALVDHENVEVAVERVHKLQWFREEYGLVETTQSAVRCIESDLDLLPGLFLSFSWDPDSGCHVVVTDYTKFDGRIFSERPQAVETILKAGYYMGHMLCPDLEAIRRGSILLNECEGFNWRKNFGVDYLNRFNTEIAAVYPMNFSSVRYFHTGLAFNTLVSMTKQFLPPEIKSKLHVGCVSEFGRLDTLYLTPTMEDANTRFLDMARASVEQYYINSREFSLD